MKTGIIEIKFKEGVSEEDIQTLISRLYTDNEKDILGMEYSQFRNKDVLIDIHRTIRARIKELDKKVVVGKE